MGRYYAMDRDKRYERIKIAFEGLVKGVGENVPVDKLTQVEEGRGGMGQGRYWRYRGNARLFQLRLVLVLFQYGFT